MVLKVKLLNTLDVTRLRKANVLSPLEYASDHLSATRGLLPGGCDIRTLAILCFIYLFKAGSLHPFVKSKQIVA